MELSAAILTLFFVIDPIGNIPIFLSVLSKVEKRKRRWILLREMVIGFGVLMTFLLMGKYLLEALHLSVAALQLSGAAVLFIIALSLVFPKERSLFHSDEQETPLIVPLAIPMIAGPSTIAVLILLASSEPERTHIWALALSIAWLISLIILMCAQPIASLVGRRGIIAMERLVGMLLIMVSAQMLIDSIGLILNTWNITTTAN